VIRLVPSFDINLGLLGLREDAVQDTAVNTVVQSSTRSASGSASTSTIY
jgi:hypothetical protein